MRVRSLRNEVIRHKYWITLDLIRWNTDHQFLRVRYGPVYEVQVRRKAQLAENAIVLRRERVATVFEALIIYNKWKNEYANT